MQKARLVSENAYFFKVSLISSQGDRLLIDACIGLVLNDFRKRRNGA